MVVLYTSLLLLLTGASVLTRRRAASLEKKYTAVLKEANTLLREPVSIPYQTATAVTQAESELGAERYKAAVARAKEYILAGDIMQVVLSQRIRRPFAAPPLSLYRALRSVNPSPYMFYYDFGDFHVVGASPAQDLDGFGDLEPVSHGSAQRLVHRGQERGPVMAQGTDLLAGGWGQQAGEKVLASLRRWRR